MEGRTKERFPFKTGEREMDKKGIFDLEVVEIDTVLRITEILPVLQSKQTRAYNAKRPDIRRPIIRHGPLLRSNIALGKRFKETKKKEERKKEMRDKKERKNATTVIRVHHL